MQQPWYATREQVKSALDFAETARNNSRIDRALTSASRSIDSLCHRKFYPWDGTKYFGYPKRDSSSWKLRLDADTLVSVSSLVSGGVTISSSDYFLEPANVGPPYDSIEIDQSSSSVFAGGDTWQRSIAITGTFGYWDEQEAVGVLADDLDADANDVASVDWTDPSRVGVGSILKIGSERLIIADVAFTDTGQDLEAAVTASNADVSLSVSDPTEFYVGQTIRVNSEVMLVVDRGANAITVKRAWDGSVLAAHVMNADVYSRTDFTIDRAQLGSTLAAHVTDDVVYRWVVPDLVSDLCIAEAVVRLQTEIGGYARADGELSGKPAPGGLRALRDQVFAAFGRIRHRAI